jgi:ornithine carbamoyltransferase
MNVDLRGRSFLTLMDFTTEEIRYLLDLAHKLKAKKNRGKREIYWQVKTLCSSLTKLLPVHAVPLKWRRWMREPV